MKKQRLPIAMVMTFALLVLSACGAAATPVAPTATPVDIGAIQTAAVQTAFAQLTEQAPTITATPLATNTPTLAPATAVPPTATVVKCEDSSFVSDVTIPDGTQMAVNQHFTKTWRVLNSGTCTWITSFYLGFSFGEGMSGQTRIPLTAAVAPGQTADLSVNLIVPNKTGKLTGVWSLYDNKGVNFGKLLTVVVTVGVPSATPTGNVTATATLAAPTETPTP